VLLPNEDVVSKNGSKSTTFQQVYKTLTTPVLLGTYAGVAVGLVPPVKRLLFDEGATLQFVGGAIDILSEACNGFISIAPDYICFESNPNRNAVPPARTCVVVATWCSRSSGSIDLPDPEWCESRFI
jgi:hypothetical protein